MPLTDGQSRPLLTEIQDLFRQQHRFSADIVDRSFNTFGDVWADKFESAVGVMFNDTAARSAAIKGYAAFAMTSLRLQAKFEKTRDYQAKTYAEAASEVYHNDVYMQSEYLPGLFLSHYLWPHHYRQIQFFESAFVDYLRVARIDRFLEVGVGTGLYSRIALQELPMAHGRGVDISPSSQAFALRQMEVFRVADRYAINLEDVVTDTPNASAEALICVEVLEHLEQPVEFLKALRRVLVPGGKAFITAALNAAHTDHIYLYRDAGEVEAQLVEAGFVTEQFFVGQAYAPPRPGLPVPLAAAFMVY
ncbi:class I SAM-dependent methyltransferase [Sphingomonas sp. KR1UV-12]|uniref:Class I SAM-dependent methyltransferase n=1 Tax=Sphingomonas aurea TaxID=3063994 RepID=A0ABT9EPC8_9SPHN|nr:class I SAM-dependent methyltransferase [Sphingomonas sp. KR1UV-12]MDP1028811.1 class I SAM-dependent methyltransferase [Sphingomonas sp. KR1UV-12]